MTEIPDEIVEVPDVPDYDLMDDMRDAELEDVLAYIRQLSVDAVRYGAPRFVERAFGELAEDLKLGKHR